VEIVVGGFYPSSSVKVLSGSGEVTLLIHND